MGDVVEQPDRAIVIADAAASNKERVTPVSRCFVSIAAIKRIAHAPFVHRGIARSATLKKAETNLRPRLTFMQPYKGEKTTVSASWCRRAATTDKAFALRALARKLANSANGFCLFASALLRRLLIKITHFHFAKNAFALHLLLQSAERLIDIVIADKYLHVDPVPSSFWLASATLANKNSVRSAEGVTIEVANTSFKDRSPVL